MRAQPDRDLSLRPNPALWQGKPTALRIALGGHLRRLREASGITREAAGYTIRSSSSKISRLELGRVASKERDVADLLTFYGVTDAEERETLLTLARQANAPGWWREYGDVLPNWFDTYLGLEQAASVIRTYEPQLVPGLLQTEDYARAVMLLRHLHMSYGEIERRVALRMARQAFLSQPGAPDLWVALDEAALRRPLGDQKIQRAQLLHLIEMAQRPNVILQIVPFDAGGHAAAGGPFTILRFSQPDLPDVVYLEHLTNAVYLDRNRDTVEYLEIMDNLCIQADSPTGTISFLNRIINESCPQASDQTTAVVAALAEADARPGDRVLIMLSEGPGFAEAFAGVIQQGAVPLPVDPLLPAHDVPALAAEAGARLVLVSADRIPALVGLEAKPPVLINGPNGGWVATLRLRQAGNSQAAN
ncbi:MAG TPA: Scr1 family TA system antitoxin-like transcriptional regulator [Pseudonocardiaceae bacterium]